MFRLNEIVKKGIEDGIIRSPYDLAVEMWQNSSRKTARANLDRLLKNQSDSIKINHIEHICKKFNVSADYLFGFSDTPNHSARTNSIKDSLYDQVRTLIDTIGTI